MILQDQRYDADIKAKIEPYKHQITLRKKAPHLVDCNLYSNEDVILSLDCLAKFVKLKQEDYDSIIAFGRNTLDKKEEERILEQPKPGFFAATNHLSIQKVIQSPAQIIEEKKEAQPSLFPQRQNSNTF